MAGRAVGSVSYGRGRFIAGQNDTVWLPPRITRRRPILYLPPGVELAWSGIDGGTYPGANALLGSLCAGGAVVVVLDWDIGTPGFYGSSWGAPQIRTNIETVRQAIVAVAGSLGADTSLLDAGTVVLAGGSQGACDCFGYAADQPTRAEAIGLWAPAIDLTGLYSGVYTRFGTSDAGTANQAAIAADWGATPPAALPASADPYDNAASVACPVLMAYSDGDATALPAATTAMAAALPDGQAIRVSTTTPHADAQAGDAARGGLAAWLLDRAT